MNRTIREAAQVLGITEAALRQHLRDSKAIHRDGSLAAKHHGAGNLFMEARVTTPKALGRPKHYAVLKVTEAGITWLAKQLGVSITEVPSKDSAA